MRRLQVLLVVLVAAVSVASAADVELVPFAAYRFGGEVKAQDSSYFDYDVEIDEDLAYGFAIDIGITSGLQIELMASRQDSDFVRSSGLFDPQEAVLPVKVTYYHVGVGWAWKLEDCEPFVIGSLGMTELAPGDAALRDETEFSASIGGGVKVWANRHVGFRFEGRGFWTNTSDQGDDWDFWNYDNDLYQGEIRAGLIIAF